MTSQHIINTTNDIKVIMLMLMQSELNYLLTRK